MSFENSPALSKSAPPPFSELMEDIEKYSSDETASTDVNFNKKNNSNSNAFMCEIKEEDELQNPSPKNNDSLEKNENSALFLNQSSLKFDDSESMISIDKKRLFNSSTLSDINDYSPEFYMSEEAHQNELQYRYCILLFFNKVIK